ncbi:hypothetical protein [Luteibacter sp. UNCMF366Tsu5.1]|uniref:hypothetical protein n=1 Tax=Luteibacter sp. UNCMF366Tsu5.1 TaxID=1502758 RepID=UPI000908BF1B|nr:hypothetical protein [Luteibacter sp. UNCMF366Tsu5.1]SFW36288.1 hypothetical protein SAMN02800691_1333 [Luteibacter sp. UNCMF366Tsu5.1]
MFGWLTCFGVPSRARSTAITTRWLALAPSGLFEGLGQLGGVLYLAASHPMDGDPDAPRGCIVEAAELAPLLATRHVGLTCAVTAEGPREWIDCVSGEGRIVARIYLLPDTDYLAWDRLFADALPSAPPDHRRPERMWLRACRARVVSFTRRQWAGLTVLGIGDAPISSLGLGVARDIAVSESIGIAA